MYKVINRKKSKIIFAASTCTILMASAFVAIFSFGFNANSFNESSVPSSALPSGELSWGLSFQNGSNAPTPDYTSQELNPQNAFYLNEGATKKLYLTFDCGYENGNTAQILDALKNNSVKGAFFVVGNYIEDNPELVARMVNEGHAVCNHTYGHPNMASQNEEDFKHQLQKLEQTFFELTGKELNKFYRPPEGRFTTENLKWASDLGYKTILWSLAHVDWKQDAQPTKEEAFEKLLPRTHDGAIVLLHNTSKTNAEILDELIKKWHSEGYTFGTLYELGGVQQ